MSLEGATALQLRLEQQRHWQLATAVRNGKQPSIDPDSHALVELRSNERVYTAPTGPYSKRIIAGAWALVELY